MRKGFHDFKLKQGAVLPQRSPRAQIAHAAPKTARSASESRVSSLCFDAHIVSLELSSGQGLERETRCKSGNIFENKRHNDARFVGCATTTGR